MYGLSARPGIAAHTSRLAFWDSQWGVTTYFLWEIKVIIAEISLLLKYHENPTLSKTLSTLLGSQITWVWKYVSSAVWHWLIIMFIINTDHKRKGCVRNACHIGDHFLFMFTWYGFSALSELQIRGIFEDESEMIFIISQRKRTLWSLIRTVF